MAAVAATGVWARPVRRLTGGLVLAITLVAFSALAIATVLPTVEADLGGLALYGWVFSAFFLASLLGTVVAGRAADRRGPAAPFAVALALVSAGLIAGGLATSMAELVAARVAQGLGAGAIPALAYAVVGRAYPPALRPRVFAVFSTAWVLPAVAGPALTTLVVGAAGWRAVFLGLLPLVVVAAVAALGPLRALGPVGGTDAGGAGRAVAGALVLVAGAAAVLAAGTVGGPGGVLLAVGGAAVAVPALARLVPAGTLRLRPGLPATVAVRGLLTAAFFSADAYVSLAVEARGGGTLLAGVALSAASLAWTAGAWVQARRLAADGPRRLDRIGFGLLAAGALGLAAVAAGLPVVLAPAAWAVGGLGMGIAYAPLAVTVLASAPRGQEGAASAALGLCDTLGVAVGTGAGGALVALGEVRGWALPATLAVTFLAAAGTAVAGVAAAGRLPARLDGTTDGAAAQGPGTGGSPPPGASDRDVTVLGEEPR